MGENVDVGRLLLRSIAQMKHGPMPGFGASHGRPFAGVLEETPVLWVTWLTYTARQMGREVPTAIEVSGVVVEIVSVKLTFGKRYFFVCPRCGHRREALYFLGKTRSGTNVCGCRACLHLGYRSQFSRASSAWPELDKLKGRKAARRRWSKDEVVRLDVRELRAQLRKGIEDMLSQVQVIEEGQGGRGDAKPSSTCRTGPSRS